MTLYNDLLIPLILAAAAGAAGFLGGYFFNNNNNGRRSLDTEAEAAQTVLQGTVQISTQYCYFI